MLGAYYTKGYDSSGLFAGLAVSGAASFSQHLNKHNVIYIDFSRMPDLCDSYKAYMTSILKNMKADLAEAYPELAAREYDSLSQMLQDTEDSFIFILDGNRPHE